MRCHDLLDALKYFNTEVFLVPALRMRPRSIVLILLLLCFMSGTATGVQLC